MSTEDETMIVRDRRDGKLECDGNVPGQASIFEFVGTLGRRLGQGCPEESVTCELNAFVEVTKDGSPESHVLEGYRWMFRLQDAVTDFDKARCTVQARSHLEVAMCGVACRREALIGLARIELGTPEEFGGNRTRGFQLLEEARRDVESAGETDEVANRALGRNR